VTITNTTLEKISTTTATRPTALPTRDEMRLRRGRRSRLSWRRDISTVRLWPPPAADLPPPILERLSQGHDEGRIGSDRPSQTPTKGFSAARSYSGMVGERWRRLARHQRYLCIMQVSGTMQMMKTKRTTVSGQLRRAVQEAELSRYEIARRTGLSESLLSRFVHRQSALSMESIDLLCECLGLKLTAKRPARKKKG